MKDGAVREERTPNYESVFKVFNPLMNVYLQFSAHVEVLFVMIRVCGINLKANNFN